MQYIIASSVSIFFVLFKGIKRTSIMSVRKSKRCEDNIVISCYTAANAVVGPSLCTEPYSYRVLELGLPVIFYYVTCNFFLEIYVLN